MLRFLDANKHGNQTVPKQSKALQQSKNEFACNTISGTRAVWDLRVPVRFVLQIQPTELTMIFHKNPETSYLRLKDWERKPKTGTAPTQITSWTSKKPIRSNYPKWSTKHNLSHKWLCIPTFQPAQCPHSMNQGNPLPAGHTTSRLGSSLSYRPLSFWFTLSYSS